MTSLWTVSDLNHRLKPFSSLRCFHSFNILQFFMSIIFLKYDNILNISDFMFLKYCPFPLHAECGRVVDRGYWSCYGGVHVNSAYNISDILPYWWPVNIHGGFDMASLNLNKFHKQHNVLPFCIQEITWYLWAIQEESVLLH